MTRDRREFGLTVTGGCCPDQVLALRRRCADVHPDRPVRDRFDDDELLPVHLVVHDEEGTAALAAMRLSWPVPGEPNYVEWLTGACPETGGSAAVIAASRACTDPAYRGTGLYSFLLALSIELARASGASAVVAVAEVRLRRACEAVGYLLRGQAFAHDHEERVAVDLYRHPLRNDLEALARRTDDRARSIEEAAAGLRLRPGDLARAREPSATWRRSWRRPFGLSKRAAGACLACRVASRTDSEGEPPLKGVEEC
jgi:hypothetical protein